MRRYRRTLRFKSIIFSIICVLIVLLTVLLLADARVRPIIKKLSVVRAQNYAALSLGESIPQIFKQSGISYENLVNIKRDTDGNIVSIETDTAKLNGMKSQINYNIASALSNLGSNELGIPAGSLTGLALLNGRGPKINVIVSVTGSAQTQLVSCFDSAGINQTRHRLYLKTVVTMLIVFTDSVQNAAYTYEMPVAETVIVGTVPGFYAGITQK